MKISNAVLALSALAHAGRLSAFRVLVKAGEKGLAAGAIAKKLRMPPSTLSANLALLAQAGLVSSTREGRSIVYTACFAAMGDLLGYLVEDCCEGRPEICAPIVNAAAACRPVGARA